jgi:hypothetical protein
LKFFPVYGPKAFAAIGKLPDTLADRSIIMTMRRRRLDQKIERFLFARAKADAERIIEALTTWAREHDEDVRTAYESVRDLAWLSDRDADLWMPMFAVCSVAAREHLHDLKNCAKALTGAKQADDVDDSLPLKLLTDIRDVWPGESANMTTASLLEKLRGLPESPWSDMTARKLAQMLRPFSVESRQVRIGDVTLKGYLHSELDDAFSRYLPFTTDLSETCETTRMTIGERDDSASETLGQ